MIVAIEGLDASGKATQCGLLVEKLKNRTRKNVVLHSFPQYNSETGKIIAGNLKRDWFVEGTPNRQVTLEQLSYTNAMVLQALMLMNRAEFASEISAAAEVGHVVLDRYTASGFVYGSVDGIDFDLLIKIHQMLPQPDVWIYLDIPVEESIRRRPERRDRYESDFLYLERVRSSYLTLFKNYANCGGANNWHVVDGLGTVEEVQARIWKCIGLD